MHPPLAAVTASRQPWNEQHTCWTYATSMEAQAALISRGLEVIHTVMACLACLGRHVCLDRVVQWVEVWGLQQPEVSRPEAGVGDEPTLDFFSTVNRGAILLEDIDEVVPGSNSLHPGHNSLLQDLQIHGSHQVVPTWEPDWGMTSLVDATTSSIMTDTSPDPANSTTWLVRGLWTGSTVQVFSSLKKMTWQYLLRQLTRRCLWCMWCAQSWALRSGWHRQYREHPPKWWTVSTVVVCGIPRFLGAVEMVVVVSSKQYRWHHQWTC